MIHLKRVFNQIYFNEVKVLHLQKWEPQKARLFDKDIFIFLLDKMPLPDINSSIFWDLILANCFQGANSTNLFLLVNEY